MAKKQIGKQFSAKQIYDFTIVKNAKITLGFDHPPSKNADGVILKYGTGDLNGKVEGGFLYYLSGSAWTKTNFVSTTASGIHDNPYKNGGPFLLGFALGAPGEYEGTPEEVGMLLKGVVTAYSVGVQPRPGAPVYGTPTPGKDGYVMFATSSLGAGSVKRILGYCIDCVEKDANGDCTSNKILMYFNPDNSYTVCAAAPNC